ncbi:hypothetical protein LINGRAPRIM_LOCUS1280 [Linum grandiflorum]
MIMEICSITIAELRAAVTGLQIS